MQAASIRLKIKVLNGSSFYFNKNQLHFWYFMDFSKTRTINEFKKNLNEIFKKFKKANYLFSLFVDECLLPVNEKTSILRDSDTVRLVVFIRSNQSCFQSKALKLDY